MASQSTNVMSMEQSELLCFVTDKSKLMAFDHIVKIVTDFYSEDDLLTARSLLLTATLIVYLSAGVRT